MERVFSIGSCCRREAGHHIAVHVEVLRGFRRGGGTTTSHDAPKKATKWTGLPSTACDLAPPTLAALTRREEAVAVVVTSNGLRGALVFIPGVTMIYDLTQSTQAVPKTTAYRLAQTRNTAPATTL